MNLTYITHFHQLVDFCQSVKTNKPRMMGVDTEFIRKTTYWPKLCLIQLALRGEVVLIDPLAENLDLTPLKDVFMDNDILKIFHAARQDLEVFHLLWGEVPQSIADTQILAMVCGFGDSVSYDKLSEALIGQKLDKSQQHTNWAQRPLSAKQISYAKGDVQNLELIYEKLLQQAGAKTAYIKEELDLLKNAGLYKTAPENAWLRIKAYGHHKPEFWGILKAIAAVREQYAQEQNMSRSHIIKDEALIQIASQSRISQVDLEKVGIKNSILQQKFLSAIGSASVLKKEFSTKSKQNPILVDVLGILLKIRSQQHGIAPKLIATKEKLEGFVEAPETSSLNQGWKFELFGESALKIMNGTMVLSFDPKTHQPSFVELNCKPR